MENKKYVVLVHDRKEGTYAYRGTGTREESVRDVNVLVEEKRIPGRRIEVVPVKGESRNESAERNGGDTTSKTEVAITTAIVTAAVLTTSYFIYRYWKKRKKNKKKKK